jgi:hypothetical protein
MLGLFSSLLSGRGTLDSPGMCAGLLASRGGGANSRGFGKRTTMDQERASYPYQRFTITTFQEEGVW